MGALLEALLNLCGYFEPATSAEILAVVGAVSLALGFLFWMVIAGRATREGIGHIAAGLWALLRAIGGLLAALLMLWLTYCLVRGTIIHIQH